MKTVYLVRHAKSSWSEEGIEDRDRPLKGRGIRDAHLVSNFLSEQWSPNRRVKLVSSPATRALHTALIFAKNFGVPAKEVEVEASLYHCSTAQVQEVLRSQDDQKDTVFVFGHNPTLLNYVNQYTGHRLNHLPTTGVACLRYQQDQWAHLGAQAELLHFEYPKRLKK